MGGAGRPLAGITTPGGRYGVIEFTLAAGAAQACGDVLMIASDARGPYLRQRPGASPDEKKVPGSDTQLLVIRFVRAAGVSGD